MRGCDVPRRRTRGFTGRGFRGRGFMGVAAVLALLLGLSPVAAQQTAPQAPPPGAPGAAAMQPVVGVIDVQQVMAKSTAAQQAVAQRDKYLDTYQARAAEVEKGLRETDQELGRLRATLPPDQFNARYQAFQTRVSEFQREVQTRRRNLERAFGAAMNEVQAAVIRAADMVAAQRGMNLLLYRTQVFLFNPSMDITDPVLARVNQDLPSVKMADPDTLPPEEDAGGQTSNRRR